MNGAKPKYRPRYKIGDIVKLSYAPLIMGYKPLAVVTTITRDDGQEIDVNEYEEEGDYDFLYKVMLADGSQHTLLHHLISHSIPDDPQI